MLADDLSQHAGWSHGIGHQIASSGGEAVPVRRATMLTSSQQRRLRPLEAPLDDRRRHDTDGQCCGVIKYPTLGSITKKQS
jgi:hypothetical protein